MTCYITQYDPSRSYDPILPLIVSRVKRILRDEDDDFLLLCVGETGSGKSNLMLHTYALFDPEGASISYIALNRRDHARALKNAKDKDGLRFCGDDEANVSKREALTQYNRERIDLYYSIRGLNMFHWWSNPSADMIEKAFVKERIRGIIVVFKVSRFKDVRFYYFFTKRAVLTILEKEKNLDLRTLRKNAKKFASWMGWFKEYQGPLKDPYLEIKGARMDEKVESFNDKWGAGEAFSLADLCREFGVTDDTLRKYVRMAIKKGLFSEEDIKNPVGRYSFSQEHKVLLEDLMKSKGGKK